MSTAENPTSGKATFDYVIGHGSLRFLACEQILDIANLSYNNSRSPTPRTGRKRRIINDLAPIWVFPDGNSNLNSWIVIKCHTWFLSAWKRFPVAFRGHLSNFKVTWAENQFGSDYSKIWRPVAATTKSIRYALSSSSSSPPPPLSSSSSSSSSPLWSGNIAVIMI